MLLTNPHSSSVDTPPRHLAVFLATSGHSGVDRIMRNLLPAIAERGVRVDLLKVKHHGPYIESVGNLRVLELGTAHTLSSFLPIMRYLRRERPDVLLSDKDRVNRVAILSRFFSRTPTRVVVRTGTTVSKDLETKDPIDRWIHQRSMQVLYPLADAIVSPSRDAAEDLSKFVGSASGKVVSIPNPVINPTMLKQSEEGVDHPWLVEKTSPVILGIGELCARKDFETLVRAFALVREKRKARLIILGEGRRRERLEKLAKNLGIADDLCLPGFVKNPYAYLTHCDLYAQSSRYEGFGVSLAESMGLGVPSISTDCPSGPREILENGKYGKLVAVGDHKAMASAITDTLDTPSDPDLLRSASKRYGLESVTTAYMNVLGLVDQT